MADEQEQEKKFDKPTIVSAVTIGGTVYLPGQEDALAEVLEAKEVEYLTKKGAIGGWGGGVKDGSRAQTRPDREPVSGLTNPGSGGGTIRTEPSVTGANIDQRNAIPGAREAGDINVGIPKDTAEFGASGSQAAAEKAGTGSGAEGGTEGNKGGKTRETAKSKPSAE